MKQTVYAIHDHAAGIFWTPLMVSRNDTVPIRELETVAHNKEGIVNRHPDQFTLYAIAEFDDETAEIEPLSKFRQVATAADLLAQDEEKQ